MPFARAGGSRIHFLDVAPPMGARSSPPLLLLHAFPLHSEMWWPQLACLSSRFRVIAPDLPGFGRSTAPEEGASEPRAFAMADYADTVAALLDELGLDRVVLGGLSMGGYVAFACLRRFPDRIAGLVLADTRTATDTAEVRERRTAQQQQVLRDGTAGVVETLLAGLLGDHSHRHRPELVQQVRRLALDNPPGGIVMALEAMKTRPDAVPELAAIDVPTVVIVGAEDRLSPPEEVEGWQEHIRGSRLAVLPLAGHLSNLEAPEEFNAEVADLLDQL